MILSVGYAVWNDTMGQVSSGDSLTAAKWNAFVDNINDINARWVRVGSNIAFTGGNVGIGTEGPTSAKLQIESVTRATPANQPLVLTSPTTAIGDKLGISFSQTDLYYRARAGIYAISELTNGYSSSLGFFTRNAEDGTQLADADEKMRITSDGRVGIGTPTPSQKLDVNGMIGIHSTVTTSLVGNIRMENDLFKIVTPSQKQWDFRDNGTVWFYNGSIWTQKL